MILLLGLYLHQLIKEINQPSTNQWLVLHATLTRLHDTLVDLYYLNLDALFIIFIFIFLSF